MQDLGLVSVDLVAPRKVLHTGKHILISTQERAPHSFFVILSLVRVLIYQSSMHMLASKSCD